MGNRDDWIADDGGFDFEEFQEDMSFASDIAGVHQRREQINELREVKSLLKQQQAEAQRKKRLPKCPYCKTSLELGSSICVGCKSELIWLKLQSALHSNTNGNVPIGKTDSIASLKNILELTNKRFDAKLTHLRSLLQSQESEIKRLEKYSKPLLALNKEDFSRKKDSESSDDGCAVWFIACFVVLTIFPCWGAPLWWFPLYLIGNDPVKLSEPGGFAIACAVWWLIAGGIFYYRRQANKVLNKFDRLGYEQFENKLNDVNRRNREIKMARKALSDCQNDHRQLIRLIQNSDPKFSSANDIQTRFIDCEYHVDTGTSVETFLESPLKLRESLNNFRLAISPQSQPTLATTQNSRSEHESGNKKYWVKRGDTVNGPISLDRIRAAFKSGKLRKSDQIAKSKDGPWATLESLLP